jgi:probable rRNA maturation factor
MPAAPRLRAPAVQLVARTKLGVGLSRGVVLARLRAMMTALNLGDAELSVLLTDDDQIQELNALYRKKDKPTDVLAFAMREGAAPPHPAEQELLGDVIVSVPTARAQARRAGRPALDEVTMLLAHGLLHLLGWDHDTPAKDRAMRAETARLCAVAVGATRATPRRRRKPSQHGEARPRKLH